MAFNSHILTLFSGTATFAAVMLATPAEAQVKAFDVAAQAASSGIPEFARQADIQILVAQSLVAGKRTQAVSGRMTVETGLKRLLAGTGLQVASNDGRTFTLTAPAEAPKFGQFSARPSLAESVTSDEGGAEIVVTGTLIHSVAPSGANIAIFDRRELENTGRGTLAEAIQTSPQVHGGGVNDATGRSGPGGGNAYSSDSTGGSSINLRGLGAEETLTLVNGRRLAPSGYHGAVGDISAIPQAAVKRVEILADGASATYGADAMAGVVNIILEDKFEGAETRLRAGIETRSGQPEFRASQTFGWSGQSSNLTLSGTYARRDGVTNDGRPYAASADLRPLGGNDYRVFSCSPGNIVYTGVVDGAIPNSEAGPVSPADIDPTRLNRCESFGDSKLTPDHETAGMFAKFRRDLTNDLTFSAEAMAGYRSTINESSYLTDLLLVPATNAFRQAYGFNDLLHEDLLYVDYRFSHLGRQHSRIYSWNVLGNVGLSWSVGDWRASAYGSYGFYDNVFKSRMIDSGPGGALFAALASSDKDTAYNPFVDSPQNASLGSKFLVPTLDKQWSDYKSANLVLDGSLFYLPAGDVRVALGSEYRRERFSYFRHTAYGGGAEISRTEAARNIIAAFSEVYLPIVGKGNEITGIQELTVSLSGRYDHYSDFGSTFNPKAGLTWRPVHGVTLRGTIGSSYKAPILRTLIEPSSVQFIVLPNSDGAPDLNGDGFTSMVIVNGGNPDLGPEKGKSWTAGIDLNPVPSIRTKFTYFNIDFNGRFAGGTIPFQMFADPASYEGISYFISPDPVVIDGLVANASRVIGTVAPAGSVEALLDSRTKNAASYRLRGIDAGVQWSLEQSWGLLTLSADVSYLIRFESRLGQSVTRKSMLDDVGLTPRWQGRGSLGWSRGDASLVASANYAGRYNNHQVAPAERVSDHVTFDLTARHENVGGGISAEIYVTNLFDRAPPFVNNPNGVAYDGANADPVGRRVAVGLTKRW